jgi:2,3,4,5-tetrahydropyridine-2-carboxylate N-succinyltransferase
LDLENRIRSAFEKRDQLQPNTDFWQDTATQVQRVIVALEEGTLRVASSVTSGQWTVNTWIKEAILLYFKLQNNQLIHSGFSQSYDKIPPRFQHFKAEDFTALQCRVVPPACVRTGAYIGPRTVLMPSYVNIGAFVDEGCMIDTWATVGSCAQIGKNVHLSGGAGIGGVLEPLQATPTIIEDNCFIGARSEIVEGVIVERNSVIGMGVFIGQSTKIYDRQTGVIHQGRVPSGSVVVPGSLPDKSGHCHLNCAIIVKTVDEKTRQKTALNELLRDH